MGKLPRDISGRQMVVGLCRAGFYVLHQKGSHVILRRDEPKTTISVPDHRQLRVGTVKAILHQAGLEVGDLIRLL